MEVHLVRHTQVDVAKGICYGQTDVDLSEEGYSRMALIQFDSDYSAIYCSPLKRCTSLLTYFQLPFETDDRLKEMDFGLWEMKAWSEIPSEEIEPWYADFVSIPATQGESLQEMAVRVYSFWSEIEKLNFEKILIVAHAGVIRILQAYWNGISLKDMFDFEVDFGTIYRFKL